MRRGEVGGVCGGVRGRDWLGVGCDPAGERVSLGWGAEGRAALGVRREGEPFGQGLP